jgi:GNAT superfamily N-acetyltransferase
VTAGPAFIETLNDLSADRVRDLLADSEATGSRIVRRLVDDWTDHTNRFDRPGEALFGAWAGGRLVGVCGLNIDPYGGDDRIGRVRRLYVLTGSRRLGIGRLLVRRVIERAGDRFDSLRLRTNNEHAARLYLGMGFRECGGMGEFTHVLQLGRSSA